MSPPSPSIYRSPDKVPTKASRLPARAARLLFGLYAPVDRKTYALVGLSLFALKYALDATVLWAATGRFWHPLTYLTPLLALRVDVIGRTAPAWLHLALGLIALPFIWIGMSMSARRAADAGRQPALGLFFVAPLLNYLVIVALCILPSAPGTAHPMRPERGEPPPALLMADSRRRALFAIFVCVAGGLASVAFAVYGLQSYGLSLFVAAPTLLGALTAFLYNRPAPRSTKDTLGVVLLAITMTGLSLLLFGVEGLVCLAMAFPISAVMAIFGGLVGQWIAQTAPRIRRSSVLPLALFPASAALEAQLVEPVVHEVSTSIDIDAPPEAVWPNVVGFVELPPPGEWIFRSGIAFPMRARIEGEGLSAVRHCEFSTGAFVEPITVWQPPERLAFDVTSQPPSMQEWSPYAHLDAPHLEGYMMSKRGEFRLVRLPSGGTRLEGSTWYTLAIYPEAYWAIFSDALLHAIHRRVLVHVRTLSEAPRAAVDVSPSPR